MWWKRRRSREDFQAEIEAHLQLEADELRSEGLPSREADTAAKRAFGNRTTVAERHYEATHWIFLRHFCRDLRYAARILFRDAKFSALAVLGLALGIAISTAIFALIDGSFRLGDRAEAQDPATYVGLQNRSSDPDLSYSDFRYYQQNATSFSAMNAESGRYPFVLSPISKDANATSVTARFESAEFLSVIGLQPKLGRTFSKEEERPGGPPVAVLNYRFWQLRFAGDPNILGMTIVLNKVPVTIIGVSDARFAQLDGASLYLPLELQPILLNNEGGLYVNERWLHVDARLRSGVTLRQAQAGIDSIAAALRRARTTNEPVEVSLTAGGVNPERRREEAAAVLAVMLTVSTILLIACFNLANLLLARAVVRRREIGVRLSLGASRARVVSQLLTESMLLAVAGGALGLLFSSWLARTVFLIMNNPPGADLPLDVHPFLYGIALTLATGVCFGLGPALSAAKVDLSGSLRSPGMSGALRSSGDKIWAPRNLLIIFPLTISLMLLLGAGSMVRVTEDRVIVAPSFDAAHLIRMSFRLNEQGYDEARTVQFEESLRNRVASMPGVASVVLAAAAPMSLGTGVFPVLMEGSTLLGGEPAAPHAEYDVVSRGYFQILSLPIIRGRAFTDSDRDGSDLVVIVNQELARRYWPDQEPLGKRIRLDKSNPFFEVVGVVPNLKDPRLASPSPVVYVPFGQRQALFGSRRTYKPPYLMDVLIRASGDPSALKSLLRRDVLATDPSLWMDIQTLEELHDLELRPARTISLFLSVLGALALLMASTGLYAILGYTVSQRTREIGIRMALGAERREIILMVMRRTAVLIAVGIAAGLAGAWALDRVLTSASGQLVGVLDAVTCLWVVVVLASVALFASYLPARKALRVDPVAALRCE